MHNDSKRNKNSVQVKTESRPILIVAIGASAGGIEAVTEMLKHLSPNTGMAFVYIQHLIKGYENEGFGSNGQDAR